MQNCNKKTIQVNKLSKISQECCLYFTANSFSRLISEMADEEFRFTGMAPSYAYLMLLVVDEPGLSQNELSTKINLKPSTLTRFFDKLVQRGMVNRVQNGREINIYATDKGHKTRILIESALNNLHKKYSLILGEDFAAQLTADINKATNFMNA
ncbi:MarR family transcriptional regulator [Marinifilum breve]|uniref:MarR family transcriptional regulator n=1 Tax=Marinifilum breve TaxID=2184082 RepID=A0A2V4A003_9BACT|nr:MarR family transcriptional regulator [Marinifilum breve]